MTANYERAVTEHVTDLYVEGGELLIVMVPKRDHLLIENIAVRQDRQGKGLGDCLTPSCRGRRTDLRLRWSSALH
jgi:hypothetical protein